MNTANLYLIAWLAIPFWLARKFRWPGLLVGMSALWFGCCLVYWLVLQPVGDPFDVVTGLIPFALPSVVAYAAKLVLPAWRRFPKWQVTGVLVVTFLLSTPLVLGLADLTLARFSRQPAFSRNEGMLRDGGTVIYQGFGYSLINYSQGGERVGPELNCIFLPFKLCNTTEIIGVRWIFHRRLLEEPISEQL
ncbi:MAG TPA: hypothetical protein VL527_00205 [Dongiaceae bacterium]|nr:hypothetical protein [Dongiaceae bacterium]